MPVYSFPGTPVCCLLLFLRKKDKFMDSGKVAAAILLACSAGMLPVFAAEAEETTAAAVPAAVSKADAHSAVTQTVLMQAPAFTTVITAEEMEDNQARLCPKCGTPLKP